MSAKVEIETSEKRFNSIEEAAGYYGLASSLIKVRISRGWSVDEACNLVARVPPVKNLDQTSFVYGWWSVQLSKYVYVGLTTNSIGSRTASHWNAAKNGKRGSFYDLLRNSEKSDFEIHELWKGEVRDVAAREIFFIKEKQTLVGSGGYNVMPGGSLGGVGVGKPVEFEERIFESAKHFARYIKLPYGFVIAKLNEGISPEEIAKTKIKSREVIVNGKCYQNLAEACKSEGAYYERVSARIRSGWTVSDAINKKEKFSGGATPVSKMKNFIVSGVTYQTISEAARAYGVDASMVKRRIGLGWDVEKALSPEKFTRKGVKNWGATC